MPPFYGKGKHTRSEKNTLKKYIENTPLLKKYRVS
jgi:hypothetical protein